MPSTFILHISASLGFVATYYLYKFLILEVEINLFLKSLTFELVLISFVEWPEAFVDNGQFGYGCNTLLETNRCSMKVVMG